MVSVGWTVVCIKCSDAKTHGLKKQARFGFTCIFKPVLSPRERAEVDKSFDPYI